MKTINPAYVEASGVDREQDEDERIHRYDISDHPLNRVATKLFF
jgi:hypothetical protein